MRFVVLLLLLLLLALDTKAQKYNATEVGAVVRSFFSLFRIPCSQWATIFDTDGWFHHPVAGAVQGRDALEDFCLSAQGGQKNAESQTFRLDGPARITSYSGGVDVLVSYVWSRFPNFQVKFLTKL